MRKLIKRVIFCLLICLLIWCHALLKDRELLNRDLIRFHVVANSDSAYDQQIKLRVRDAVLADMCEDLQCVCDKESAEMYIRENLPKIQQVVDRVLQEYGYDCEAVISYCQEAFPIREYTTFSLPSGIYDTLRITLGRGEGQNWWCVSFPSLCLGTTAEEFEDIAVSSGFGRPLTNTLTNKNGYRIRFFLLDKIGELQKAICARNDCKK
jgi:stage II sporulation protein R